MVVIHLLPLPTLTWRGQGQCAGRLAMMGDGAGGRWVGSCQSTGPAWLGLFKSGGHTQWGPGMPLSLLLSHLLSHLLLRGSQPLAFSSCSPPAGPQGWLFRAPTGRYPLSLLVHVPPSTAGLPGLCLCRSTQRPSLSLSTWPSTHDAWEDRALQICGSHGP